MLRWQPLLLLATCSKATLRVALSSSAAKRWSLMCREEETLRSDMLRGWIDTRWDVVNSQRAELEDVEPAAARPVAKAAPVPPPVPCPYDYDVKTAAGAIELLGTARAEIECTAQFMQATINHGRRLLREKQLHTYDIMHEVIRADTGYRLQHLNQRPIPSELFDDFLSFQQELTEVLNGWTLWEYEFVHWKYHKRPTVGIQDEYAHLYNQHRAPEFQHMACPGIPLVYRMWTNFPTCPPSRLRDLPRFTDAYISALTVDNWRASYQSFLSEDYNSNTSFFAGGDPMHRLSKGAHSIFAGVFIQKLPTDLWCYQQVIHDLRPQYIIDLGSSQGGSAVWFASMLKLFEIDGQVISIDLPLEQAYWLTKKRAEEAARRLKVEDKIDWNYVKDGSKNKSVRKKVERLCSKSPCMVVSDSDHDYAHTYWEMEWYAKQVGVGQYLVVEDTNIYGWNGWININDPNDKGTRKGPMEAANDFEFNHRADYVRTDWCTRHYGLSQSPNGWFFRKAYQARGLSD